MGRSANGSSRGCRAPRCPTNRWLRCAFLARISEALSPPAVGAGRRCCRRRVSKKRGADRPRTRPSGVGMATVLTAARAAAIIAVFAPRAGGQEAQVAADPAGARSPHHGHPAGAVRRAEVEAPALRRPRRRPARSVGPRQVRGDRHADELDARSPRPASCGRSCIRCCSAGAAAASPSAPTSCCGIRTRSAIGDNVVVDDQCCLDAKGSDNRGIRIGTRGVHRPQHDPELQERRHRGRRLRQHRLQRRDLLGLARAGGQAGADCRLHLPGRRRSPVRPHRHPGARPGPDGPRHRGGRQRVAGHARRRHRRLARGQGLHHRRRVGGHRRDSRLPHRRGNAGARPPRPARRRAGRRGRARRGRRRARQAEARQACAASPASSSASDRGPTTWRRWCAASSTAARTRRAASCSRGRPRHAAPRHRRPRGRPAAVRQRRRSRSRSSPTARSTTSRTSSATCRRAATRSTPGRTSRSSRTPTRSTATGFVAQLQGMFAIALWDGRTRTLIAARDRAGEKPLYYAQHAEGGLRPRV